MTFRTYVADALNCIAENTANPECHRYIAVRYSDLLDINEETETRDPDEVINRVKKGLRRIRGEEVEKKGDAI